MLITVDFRVRFLVKTLFLNKVVTISITKQPWLYYTNIKTLNK